jgi:hypothetical protein
LPGQGLHEGGNPSGGEGPDGLGEEPDDVSDDPVEDPVGRGFAEGVKNVGSGPTGTKTEVAPDGDKEIETQIEVSPEGDKDGTIPGGKDIPTQLVPEGDIIRGTETETVPDDDMEYETIKGGSLLGELACELEDVVTAVLDDRGVVLAACDELFELALDSLDWCGVSVELG